MVEVEEKLPCAFGLKADCQVRRFIRQAFVEQRITMQIPMQKVGTEGAFPKELEALMQGMFGAFTKIFQVTTELQTLSNFCVACVRLKAE